jgi:hypothetical protein
MDHQMIQLNALVSHVIHQFNIKYHSHFVNLKTDSWNREIWRVLVWWYNFMSALINNLPQSLGFNSILSESHRKKEIMSHLCFGCFCTKFLLDSTSPSHQRFFIFPTGLSSKCWVNEIANFSIEISWLLDFFSHQTFVNFSITLPFTQISKWWLWREVVMGCLPESLFFIFTRRCSLFVTLRQNRRHNNRKKWGKTFAMIFLHSPPLAFFLS